jgi:hypothetical protein
MGDAADALTVMAKPAVAEFDGLAAVEVGLAA